MAGVPRTARPPRAAPAGCDGSRRRQPRRCRRAAWRRPRRPPRRRCASPQVDLVARPAGDDDEGEVDDDVGLVDGSRPRRGRACRRAGIRPSPSRGRDVERAAAMPITRSTSGARSSAARKGMPISPVGPVTATVRPVPASPRRYPLPGRPGPLRCHSTWPSPSARERPSTSSHSCSIRFRRATASGGWAATSAASSSAASSVAAAGATRLTSRGAGPRRRRPCAR